MKKSFFFLLGLITSISLLAQYSPKDRDVEETGKASKAVYGEFLGGGLIFSANFDTRFKGYKGLGLRVGIGGAGGTGGGILTFPIGLNYLAGEGPHHFEAGATFTLVTAAFDFGGDTGSDWFAMPHLGYRYTKPSNSFNGRIYVGPFIGNGLTFFPFGGLSVGFTL